MIRAHHNAPSCVAPLCCSMSPACNTCPPSPLPLFPPYYTLCPSLESTASTHRVHPRPGSTNQRRGERWVANQAAAGSLFLAPDKMAADLLVIPVLRVWWWMPTSPAEASCASCSQGECCPAWPGWESGTWTHCASWPAHCWWWAGKASGPWTALIFENHSGRGTVKLQIWFCCIDTTFEWTN